MGGLLNSAAYFLLPWEFSAFRHTTVLSGTNVYGRRSSDGARRGVASTKQSKAQIPRRSILSCHHSGALYVSIASCGVSIVPRAF